MPFYLIQYSYTAESWRALVEGTTERDRHKAVEPLLKRHGGRFPTLTFEGDPPIVVQDKLYIIGESEMMAIAYFPDNERAAAFAMSVLAGGGVAWFKIKPLMTLEDAMRSMDMAGRAISVYAPPQQPSKA